MLLLVMLCPAHKIPDRLACARALAHDSPHYRTVKTILSTGADRQPLAQAPTPPAYASPTRFTRPAAELFPPTPQHLH